MKIGLSKKIYTKALNKTKSLAEIAGSYIIKNLGKTAQRFKGKRDIVTLADEWVEKFYKRAFYKEFPDFDYLAEESSNQLPNEEFYWVVDPIDGTNNYAHQYPVFSTSIALVHRGKTLFGVVYDPTRKELFWADKERSYLNKKQIRVSMIEKLENSLVCTGFPYRLNELENNNVDFFLRLLYVSQGMRRSGSAALDLCYVSCGRLDGFWELHLKPWDTAAGSFIVEKAGGKISKINGSSFDIFYPEIVSSNGKIHREMLESLRGEKNDKFLKRR